MGRTIKKVKMDCVLCDKTHDVNLNIRLGSVIIKGELIEYEEQYYECSNYDEENEFIDGELLDKNIINAQNVYRIKHNLLTSYEIKEIRRKYNLSQKDFALILGLGEVTITRYESKTVQDKTYDLLIRQVDENPLLLKKLFDENKDKLTSEKLIDVKKAIKERIKDYELELKKKELEYQYALYEEPSEYNGYKKVDLSKVESIIKYLLNNNKYLYKVKAAKLLWYIDMLSYKNNRKSMSGMIYQKMPLGAYPKAFDELLYLLRIKQEEILFDNGVGHRLYYDGDVIDNLSNKEKEIIDEVNEKFKYFNTKQIVDYMHKEKAFIKTKFNEDMSYEYANEIEF